jgi:hypothetical protein
MALFFILESFESGYFKMSFFFENGNKSSVSFKDRKRFQYLDRY